MSAEISESPVQTGRFARVVANVGCGEPGAGRLPAYFKPWRELRVDVDRLVKPDILADLTDLSAIPEGSVDALWASHCIEHLFLHEVPRALSEFHRVLKDGGFALILVPDLQAISRYVSEDRIHDVVYQSAAGPITAHDMFYGFGAAIARGRTSMAHRCGFTPSLLMHCVQTAAFTDVVLRRRSSLELLAMVHKGVTLEAEQRNALLLELGL